MEEPEASAVPVEAAVLAVRSQPFALMVVSEVAVVQADPEVR